MFRLTTSLLVAICLIANVVMGCAMVGDGLSNKAMNSFAQDQNATAMQGCDQPLSTDKDQTNHHSAQRNICKTFCASLMAVQVVEPTERLTVASVGRQETTTDANWDSSVDPPHPRETVKAI